MIFKKALAALFGLTVVATASTAQAQLSIDKVGTASSTGSTSAVSDVDTVDWVVRVLNETDGDITNVNIADQLIGDQGVVPGSFTGGVTTQPVPATGGFVPEVGTKPGW